MEWEFGALDRDQRYKLLTGLVIPRPIALVTTRGANGVINAAPFSFFSCHAGVPSFAMISVGQRAGGELKDTAANVIATREFVVNLVDEPIAERMHACSIDFPPRMSELELVGLSAVASRAVAPPRISEAPVSLECRLHTDLYLGEHHLFIGEILWLHAREGIVDPETLRTQLENYHAVGRLFGNRYCHTNDTFSLDYGNYAAKLAAGDD